MSFDPNDWKPLKENIELSQKLVRNLIEKHFNSQPHHLERREEEIQWFLDQLRFITRKWNIDVLYQLSIHQNLSFNDLRRHLHDVSSRTLSDRLKQLQSLHLVERVLIDSRPPSTLYHLSEKGQGFVELSMLLIYFLAVE